MTADAPATEPFIRPIEPADADAAAGLALQLGYQRPAAAVRHWIENMPASGDQVAFVACLGAQVAGWIEVSVQKHLQSEPYALISGLVIREGLRGKGIGRLLCERAEQWAWNAGVTTVRVTSRSTRTDAHRFYLKGGYRKTKTSHVFEKASSF